MALGSVRRFFGGVRPGITAAATVAVAGAGVVVAVGGAVVVVVTVVVVVVGVAVVVVGVDPGVVVVVVVGVDVLGVDVLGVEVVVVDSGPVGAVVGAAVPTTFAAFAATVVFLGAAAAAGAITPTARMGRQAPARTWNRGPRPAWISRTVVRSAL